MLKIPFNNRVGSLNFKRLLKQSVGNLLPDEILNSRKKGFVLPVVQWLKNDLKDELMIFSEKSFLKDQNIFSTNLRETLVHPFLSNKYSDPQQIWTWWMFQRWWSTRNSNRDL